MTLQAALMGNQLCIIRSPRASSSCAKQGPPSQYHSPQSFKKPGVPKPQCIFLGFKCSAAFFSSVHLSSRCPITSEPGLLNATQTDSQEACLLNRVLATSYPQNYRFLAAQEEWRKHCGVTLCGFSLPDFSIFVCTRTEKKNAEKVHFYYSKPIVH